MPQECHGIATTPRIQGKMTKMLNKTLPVLLLVLMAFPRFAFSQGTDIGVNDSKSQPPNVLIWLMDDVGFAQLSSFGGLIETPNIDRVAAKGLRYSNFHATPICSSSRASLLSGRNPHSVHVGGHAATARPYPGYDAHIPASAGSIAANLRQAGYRTFALGKWDHLPTEEASPAGPYRQWPAGQGFDHFYGFLAADNDNWNPILVRDLSSVARPTDPDYHLNRDLADQAIAMIRSRDGQSPGAPFFMYWATGTAHAPHHAPRQWIDGYSGKFDMGWDRVREKILKKQVAKGLVPNGTELAPRPDGMPPWDSLSHEQKKLYTRQMEVFAASLSYADGEFGRILDELEARGELDNTLVIITSDNGASAEGALDGVYNEASLITGSYPGVRENMAFYDQWGGPETYPHYSFGWAVAGNTPFRYYKQTAHEGGIHVPLIVAWPDGIAARGGLRKQFVHISDVAPTILDAAGVQPAEYVNNVKQSPMEGQSFAYSFDNPDAADRKRAQYFEMYGNKSLWSEGWSIVTTHRFRTWELMTSNSTFDEPWELYDLANDPGQTRDLAAKFPDRVAEMDQMFQDQAGRFNVYPIGDMGEGAREAFKRGRMEFARRGGIWHYTGPIGNIPSLMAPPVNSLSFKMTAELDLSQRQVTGPVFANGSRLGGLALYLRDGKPVFLFNTAGGKTSELAAADPLPAGETTLELTFINGEPGSQDLVDHQVTISANGSVLAEGTLQLALPRSFGISETFGVGIDNGSAVLPGGIPDAHFPGQISDLLFQFTVPPGMQAAGRD